MKTANNWTTRKRLRRLLWITSAALAGLFMLCWMASFDYAIGCTMPLSGDDNQHVLVTAREGRLEFTQNWGTLFPNPGWSASVYSLQPLRELVEEYQEQGLPREMFQVRPAFERFSVFSTHPNTGQTFGAAGIRLPLWLPVLLLGTWPLFELFLWWRQRRHKQLHPLLCEQCGYSLAGINNSTCPECGFASTRIEIIRR